MESELPSHIQIVEDLRTHHRRRQRDFVLISRRLFDPKEGCAYNMENCEHYTTNTIIMNRTSYYTHTKDCVRIAFQIKIT
jgi:hypothetical protein